MYKIETYAWIFGITAVWDLVWRWMSTGKIYICINKLLCPNSWKWVKTGENYFKTHSTIGAMLIAGISGIYALAVMDIVNTVFSLSVYDFSQILVCLFASWVVGFPMRYAPDAIHTYLFNNLRIHYYKPLGFLHSSYSDAQSGIIVMITYLLIQNLLNGSRNVQFPQK